MLRLVNTLWLGMASSVMLGTAYAAPVRSPPASPVSTVLDRSQADAALAILEVLNKGRSPSAAQRSALFSSRPYLKLQERAKAFNNAFSNEEFLARLGTPEMRAKAPALAIALNGWTPARVAPAAKRALAYLPAGSTLRARIYPVIKSSMNTFVYDVQADPGIFFTVNPDEAEAKISNTLAHELHHIGLGQNCGATEMPGSGGLKTLRKWVSAFGEGLAMLAAAGGPEVDPHGSSSPSERALWNAEIAKADDYLRQQNAFFLDVLDGTAGDEERINKAMFAYFGEAQGPWYSVGYQMAVTIEREFGRAATIQAFCRSNGLLMTYNRAAAARNARGGRSLATWDARLAAGIAN